MREPTLVRVFMGSILALALCAGCAVGLSDSPRILGYVAVPMGVIAIAYIMGGIFSDKEGTAGISAAIAFLATLGVSVAPPANAADSALRGGLVLLAVAFICVLAFFFWEVGNEKPRTRVFLAHAVIIISFLSSSISFHYVN